MPPNTPPDSSNDATPDYIAAWRAVLVGAATKSWVLFEHGTIVILMQPSSDLRAQAIALMKDWGPVHVGSPAGDFSTVTLTDHPGWAVTCHHNDILTYVAPSEMSQENPSDLAVGLYGRSKRDADARSLTILHVEDRRGAAPAS